MLLSAVRCFELLSLSVLRECAEEQNQAKQSPGKSCTATRERTVSAVSGPMKSVPKREQGKADIQGVLSPAQLSSQNKAAALAGPLSQPCLPALSPSLRQLTFNGHKRLSQVAVNSCVWLVGTACCESSVLEPSTEDKSSETPGSRKGVGDGQGVSRWECKECDLMLLPVPHPIPAPGRSVLWLPDMQKALSSPTSQWREQSPWSPLYLHRQRELPLDLA